MSGKRKLKDDPDIQNSKKVFGERVAKARERKGLTQYQAAKLCNIDLTAYKKIELGESNMRFESMIKIFECFGIDLYGKIDELIAKIPETKQPRD